MKRRTLTQIDSPALAAARAYAADQISHIIKYADHNLNGRSDDKIKNSQSLFRDAFISTFVSLYPNNLLRDALLDSGAITEDEHFNFSNVHLNLPADATRKVFMSFDAYSTLYNMSEKRVTGFVFWEVNTYLTNQNDARRKFVNYGLDRIDFIRKGLEETESEWAEVRFFYVILADLDDYNKAGIKAIAEKKGINVVFIDYGAIKDILDKLAIEMLVTTEKTADAWRLFVEHLEEAGIDLSDIIEVYAVKKPAPKTEIVVKAEIPVEQAEIPVV